MAEEAHQNGWLPRLERAAERGAAVAVRPGVFLPARRWRTLSGPDRTLARIYAAALAHPDVVFAHHSAAALYRLPLPEADLPRIHVVGAPAGAPDLVAHPESAGDTVARFGLRVTSPVQTVLDMAVVLDEDAALTLVRAALRPSSRPHALVDEPPLCTKSQLLAAAEAVAERTGDATPVEVARAVAPGARSIAA